MHAACKKSELRRGTTFQGDTKPNSLPVQAVKVTNVTLVAFNVTILMTIFLVFAADEIIATYSEGDVLFDGNFGA